MLHLRILQMHARGDEMEQPSPTSRLGHAGFGPEGLGWGFVMGWVSVMGWGSELWSVACVW